VLETTPSNAGGAATQTDYCVGGDVMHFVNLDPAIPAGSSPPPTITGDTMLERQ